MAIPRVWKNVAVAMQSAIAAAVPITAISHASPGVVTTSGTAPANGAYVLVNAVGMSQVDGRIFRVSATGSGTFSLEGEDTTVYDDFTSGTFQVLTMGTSITSATTISASGGDATTIDTTTIHASVRTSIAGLPSALGYNFDNIWDIADPGQVALKRAADAGGQRALRFTFGLGGPIMVFNASVSFSGLPAGAAQELVTTPASLALAGRPTYYAT